MKKFALILFAALTLSACYGGDGEPVGWGGSVNEVHMNDNVTCYVVVTIGGEPKSIDCLAK